MNPKEVIFLMQLFFDIIHHLGLSILAHVPPCVVSNLPERGRLEEA
jgi:hypothetical protein